MKLCTCEDTFYKPTVKNPVVVESLSWHADGRGKLLECLRMDSPHYQDTGKAGTGIFGQAYVTTVKPGVIKAWHKHENQTDRMILLRGTMRFGCVLEMSQEERKQNTDSTSSATPVYQTSGAYETVLDLVVDDYDPKLVIIPANIYHGFMNVGTVEAYILNIPDNMYDYQSPDEQREKCTRFSSVFDWRARMDG